MHRLVSGWISVRSYYGLLLTKLHDNASSMLLQTFVSSLPECVQSDFRTSDAVRMMLRISLPVRLSTCAPLVRKHLNFGFQFELGKMFVFSLFFFNNWSLFIVKKDTDIFCTEALQYASIQNC